MKPLYLDGTSPLRVSLDGPALEVLAPACAARLFPLRRVSRVVVSGHVEWDTEALLACAEQGITVSFLDARGDAVARLIGRDGERSSLALRVHDFLDRPDWRALYAQWRQAMSRRAARMCAWRLRLDLEANNRTILCIVRYRLVSRLARGYPKWTERRLRGLLYASATARIQAMGLGRDAEFFSGLPNHLASILTWCLYPELLLWVDRAARRPLRRGERFAPTSRALAGFYEANAERASVELDGALNRLHRWIVELI